MKAVIVKAPNKVIIENIPDPAIGKYDVLCRVLAVGVCNGTDNNIVAGDPYHKVKFPAVLGHEGIGEVIAIGSKVRHLKIGDVVTRVFQKLPKDCGYQILYGAFAEKAIATDWLAMKEAGLPQSVYGKLMVHRVLPENFDPIESTMIITWRETFSFLSRMKPKPANEILIIGTGANALSFLDHSKNIGLNVSVVGSPLYKKKFLKKGASVFVSYKEKKLLKVLSESKKSFNIIIDTVGNSPTLNKVLPSLKINGKIGVYGLDGFLGYKIDKSKARGKFKYFSGEEYNEASAHDAIIKFIQSGQLNAWDYLSKNYIYPLSKIKEALSAGEKRKVLKSVVVIAPKN